jgi:hypothetical protein
MLSYLIHYCYVIAIYKAQARMLQRIYVYGEHGTLWQLQQV